MDFKDIIVLCFVIVGIFLFYNGFHTIDNGWNMDSGCLDMAIDGKTVYTKTELYFQGLRQMFASLIVLLLAIIISNIRVNKTLYFSSNNN